MLRMGHLVASVPNYISKDEYSALGTLALGVLADAFTPEMLVETVADYTRLIGDLTQGKEEGKNLNEIVQKFASTYQPYRNLLRDVKGYTDPFQRDTKPDLEAMNSFMNEFVKRYKSVIPGMSTDLPKVRNIFGEALIMPMGSMEEGMPDYSMFDALAKSTEKGTAVHQWIEKMAGFHDRMAPRDSTIPKLTVAMPARTITVGPAAVELSPAEYERMVMYTAGLDPETGRSASGLTLREEIETQLEALTPLLQEEMSVNTYKRLYGIIQGAISRRKEAAKGMMLNDEKFLDRWHKVLQGDNEEQLIYPLDTLPGANLP
jgi:hypothetical protein